MTRRVLVTGADGGIGRETVRHLVARGYAVTALSTSFEAATLADRVVVADARSAGDVADALDGCDAVVHLAAIPHPSLGTPLEVFTTNTTATFTVLSVAGERGVRRAVIASSINAVGVPQNPHPALPAYLPIDENLPPDIGDAYSLSKLVDEMSARMAARRWGISVAALRFPLVKPRDVLLQIADQAAERPADLRREAWSYLDVRDAARAIEHALRAPFSGAQVVGLSAADTLVPVDTDTLVHEHLAGVPVRRPLHGRESLIDTARAEAVLGFTPRHSIHAPELAVVQSDVLEAS